MLRKAPRRRIKDEDKAWKPYNPRKKSANGSILPMRADTCKTVVVNGETVDLGIAFMVPDDAMKRRIPVTNNQATALIAPHLRSSALRPVHEVIEYSIAGSPLAVTTPVNKTVLRLDADYGTFRTFSNRPQNTDNAVLRDSIELLKLHGLLMEVAATSQQLHVTHKHMKAVEKERRTNNYRRSKSQKAAFNNESAAEHSENFWDQVNQTAKLKIHCTSLAQAQELIQCVNKIIAILQQQIKEIGHEIDHKSLGKLSQVIENLFVQLKHSNTKQCVVEESKAVLDKHYPDAGYDLDINVPLLALVMPGKVVNSRIGTQVTYTISTYDFTIAPKIDALDTRQPHIIEGEIQKALVKSLIPDCPPSADKRPIAARTRQGQVVNSQTFFSKSQFAQRADENKDAAADNANARKKLKF